ncbi:MAG: hypothetical protein P8M36_07145 [Gammaproteobacteria bacterium]|nr:hypothetical protein [Gammaproteobacteria bacterium]
MSLYQVQKLIQKVNRDEKSRANFLASNKNFIGQFELTLKEKEALIKLEIQVLYKMGVHPLLLRPFTIIHGISEPDYLQSLKEKGKF